jgi:predicted TIM-barrel fold metal-dependent hydrolase
MSSKRKTASRPTRTGEVLRIDGHVHGNPGKFRGSAAAYVKKIRKQGIHAIGLIQPGEMVLAARKKFGDFVIPIARVRMDACGPDEIERWLDAGCPAIKFIRPRHPYSDERYWPLYEVIEKRKALAVFHTGYLAFGAREERPANMQHMRAAEIDTLTRRFPDLKTVMAHFSNPWWEEAWKISWTRENVWTDLSGATAINRSMSTWAETFAPNGKLIASSLKKLTFASDVDFLHNREHDFKPYIDFYEELLERVKAPAALRRKVWGGTMARLLGLKL